MKKTLSEWQLCPKCNGFGIISNAYLMSTASSPFVPCDVCNGSKILIKPTVEDTTETIEFAEFILADYEIVSTKREGDSEEMNYWQLAGTNQVYSTEELFKEFKEDKWAKELAKMPSLNDK